MNAKQSNKLTSYAATEAVLKGNPEVANVPGLPGKLATLSSKIGEIHLLALTQTEPLRVFTARRDRVFEAMTEMTLDIAGRVANVASDLKRPDLAQSVTVHRNAFLQLRPSQRVWLAQRVFDAAQGVLAPLGAYGVTAETMDAFKARIEDASVGIHMVRTAVNAKSGATERLVSLFREVDALLKHEIDRLVYPMRLAQPEFYANYTRARSIVDLRGRRALREDGDASGAPDTVALAPPAVAAADTGSRVLPASDPVGGDRVAA